MAKSKCPPWSAPRRLPRRNTRPRPGYKSGKAGCKLEIFRSRACCFDFSQAALHPVLVEILARTLAPVAPPSGALARVTNLVQTQLDEVEQRIIKQVASFDPAIEGYVAYAI